MQLIQWHNPGEKTYETGASKAVLYTQGPGGTFPSGVAWNGISSVTESPSGAEPTAIYADNIKYANLMSAEEYGASIEAFTYPDEFTECDGSKEIAPGVLAGQQTRKPFGLSWQTIKGNELEGNDYGYKIHIFYNGLASPSEKAYSTINDSPEIVTFSWDVTTTPLPLPKGFKPTASITIDSTTVDPIKLAEFEKIIYGTAGETEETEIPARLPLPMEIVELLGVASVG